MNILKELLKDMFVIYQIKLMIQWNNLNYWNYSNIEELQLTIFKNVILLN